MVYTGRILTTALAFWSCGLAATCFGQGRSPAGHVVTLPASASGYSYNSPAFTTHGASQAAYCPPPQGMAIEEPSWWKTNQLFIHPGMIRPPRGAYVRLEYLLWSIEEPGNQLVGAAPLEEAYDSPDRDFDQGYDSNALFDDNFNPARGYIVHNPVFQVNQGRQRFPGLRSNTGFRYVPRMTELQLRDNSGIRLTFGIPTYEYGTIELSGWLLEQASDHYQFGGRQFVPVNEFQFLLLDPHTGTYVPPRNVDPFVPKDAVVVNGDVFKPSVSVNVNDGAGFVSVPFDTIDVAYRSNMWGLDAAYVVDALAPDGEGFKLKPVVGVKYVSLQESMYVRGVRNPLRGATVISNINSGTTNNYVGGMVGLRAELVHRWFVLGVQPGATFAANIAESSVTSERFTTNGSPYRDVSSSYFDFAPILNLKTYARVKLGDHWRATVGYNAMWISRAFRPSQSVDYRVNKANSGVLNSDVDTKNSTDQVTVDGISLGLEYVF